MVSNLTPRLWALARTGALTAVILLTAAPSAVEAGGLSPDLQRELKKGSTRRIRTIVRTVGTGGSSIISDAFGKGARFRKVGRSGRRMVVEMTPSMAEKLAKRADVLSISPDRPVGLSTELASSAVGAATVRDETRFDGAGVGVAVLDTGVAQHPDLTTPENRINGWFDAVNGLPTPYDDHGHGTHVAGLIAGNGASTQNSGHDLRGIAPSATVIGVKVINGKGQGTLSSVIDGLEYCLENRARLNIKVINLSLSGPALESYRTDPLCQVVEECVQAGIVVVCSAGNFGRINPSDPNSGTRYGFVGSPGIDPLVITVGATKSNGTAAVEDDDMATFSSRGPTLVDRLVKPDLVAPGNKIVGLLAAGTLS